jgi:hypothetical protein
MFRPHPSELSVLCAVTVLPSNPMDVVMAKVSGTEQWFPRSSHASRSQLLLSTTVGQVWWAVRPGAATVLVLLPELSNST